MTAKVSGITLFSIEDAEEIGLVQLTNWLPGYREELSYLVAEHKRISSDKSRTCKLVCEDMRYALFVNDMTNGAFSQLREDDD